MFANTFPVRLVIPTDAIPALEWMTKRLAERGLGVREIHFIDYMVDGHNEAHIDEARLTELSADGIPCVVSFSTSSMDSDIYARIVNPDNIIFFESITHSYKWTRDSLEEGHPVEIRWGERWTGTQDDDEDPKLTFDFVAHCRKNGWVMSN